MSIDLEKQTIDVLAEVPDALRHLLEENTKLASELKGFRQRSLAEDIVAEMERKGLSDPSEPFQDKVAALLSSDKDLEVVKEAMEMATPNFSFASVAETEAEDDNSSMALESFILGSG